MGDDKAGRIQLGGFRTKRKGFLREPNLPTALIGVLFHEILVERLDLGDVVFYSWAERGDSQMIRPFLLTEPGPSDCTDSSRVCEQDQRGRG